MNQNTASVYLKNITSHRETLKFPSADDLNGAATGLFRLQNTYQLDTHKLASGELLGKMSSKKLTAEDCWELGRQSYLNGDHYYTVLWMAEAMDKYHTEKQKTVALDDILEYLAISTYFQGNIREAFELNNQLLRLVPNHAFAKSNANLYLDAIMYYDHLEQVYQAADGKNQQIDVNIRANRNRTRILPGRKFSVTNLKLNNPALENPASWKLNYLELCRGERLMDAKAEGALRCRYVTNNNPFLLLAPVKEEEVFLKPRLVVYHDVISEEEMETVKRLSKPKFKNAGTASVNGRSDARKIRVAKSAVLSTQAHHHIEKIERRVGYITGLNMKTSEELQTVNYGIGGQYEPHHDYCRPGESMFSSRLATWGNRIATWLFYMSDVEAGGSTVFTELNVALSPRKGSAAFWHNLLPSGQVDERTRHASCPVLSGSKWISTFWIHEREQEFSRPCKLDSAAEHN